MSREKKRKRKMFRLVLLIFPWYTLKLHRQFECQLFCFIWRDIDIHRAVDQCLERILRTKASFRHNLTELEHDAVDTEKRDARS